MCLNLNELFKVRLNLKTEMIFDEEKQVVKILLFLH